MKLAPCPDFIEWKALYLFSGNRTEFFSREIRWLYQVARTKYGMPHFLRSDRNDVLEHYKSLNKVSQHYGKSWVFDFGRRKCIAFIILLMQSPQRKNNEWNVVGTHWVLFLSSIHFDEVRKIFLGAEQKIFLCILTNK